MAARTGRDASSRDVALLALAQPIRTPSIHPMGPAEGRFRSTEVGIVSYAMDRSEAPSLQESCQIIGTGNGAYILTCAVDFGASGAPVFQIDGMGAARVGAVVSAKAMLDDRRVAIGAPVADLLPELMDAIRRVGTPEPGGIRVLTPGQRTEIGARFVRPGGS